MADSGKSVPDKTNAQNPSETGVPSVDSQGTDVAVKGGSAKVQRGQSDSERNPNNHTVRYGADAANTQANQPKETPKQYTERLLVERHGEAIRDNPNFDAMVKEEIRQIDENRENTKGM